jgi:hypothetical protein
MPRQPGPAAHGRARIGGYRIWPNSPSRPAQYCAAHRYSPPLPLDSRAVFARWHGPHELCRFSQTSLKSGRSRIGILWSTSVAALSGNMPLQCVWISQSGSAASFIRRKAGQVPQYPRSFVVPRLRSLSRAWARHRLPDSAKLGQGCSLQGRAGSDGMGVFRCRTGCRS